MHVLPKIVERPVEEDSVSAANHRPIFTPGVQRETEPRSKVPIVRRKQLLIAGGRIDHRCRRDFLGKSRSRAELNQRVLVYTGVDGSAEIFIAESEVENQAGRNAP